MFERNYYSLVAGLKEYALEADNKGFDAREIIETSRCELSSGDRRTLELFYGSCDVANLIGLRSGKTNFSSLGNFSREELEQALEGKFRLPSYLADVVAAYADPEGEEAERMDMTRPFERNLYESYYRACAASKCRFLREWSDFDRTLRNVCAAYSARRSGVAPETVVVGHDDITDSLSRSSASDFGLKGELEYLDDVVAAVSDERNLLEKERKIDRIRWRMSDELAISNYFDMAAILSYLVKVNLVERWFSLDEATGRRLYDKLLTTLSGSELIDRAVVAEEKTEK